MGKRVSSRKFNKVVKPGVRTRSVVTRAKAERVIAAGSPESAVAMLAHANVHVQKKAASKSRIFVALGPCLAWLSGEYDLTEIVVLAPKVEKPKRKSRAKKAAAEAAS